MKVSLKPHLALIGCNVVWAFDYPFYHLLLPGYISPVALATSALVVAAFFSLCSLPFSPRERVSRRDAFRFVGAALLMGVLKKIFLMEGLSQTSPIDGSIIDTITPILVLILSVVLHIDRFTPLKVAGIVLGMGGAVMVVLFGRSGAHPASHLVGNLYIFLCAACTAVYMVWFKKLVSRYSPLTVLRWLYCLAAVMILPFGIRDVVQTDYGALSGFALFAFIFVLVVPTFVPNLLLIYSLKYVAPTVSSIYAYIQPVLATALAVGLGMDRIRWDTVVAAAVIFLGVFCVVYSYRHASNLRAPTAHLH